MGPEGPTTYMVYIENGDILGVIFFGPDPESDPVIINNLKTVLNTVNLNGSTGAYNNIIAAIFTVPETSGPWMYQTIFFQLQDTSVLETSGNPNGAPFYIVGSQETFNTITLATECGITEPTDPPVYEAPTIAPGIPVSDFNLLYESYCNANLYGLQKNIP